MNNNNKIKNVNKARHYIKINNKKKNAIFKRNNTIEYENDHKYESIFNHSQNKSSNKKDKIIQYNNNYKIKDRNNHIFQQKLIGKNNAINLTIPSKSGNDYRFKLLNSFNQNNKSYNHLRNSKIHHLSKNSNSFNSDFIKDSFNSFNNSLNKNKGISKYGIMKNYLIAKNSFYNLYNNNNKIISDYNGVHDTLNKDEKLNKKNILYHTPLLVRKVLKKKK